EFRQGFPESAAAPDEWVYPHSPPGPEFVCSFLVSLFGNEHLWVLRLFPLCLCLLATAVFFKTLAMAFGTDRAALVAIACVLLPMFNTYMPGPGPILPCQSFSHSRALASRTRCTFCRSPENWAASAQPSLNFETQRWSGAIKPALGSP